MIKKEGLIEEVFDLAFMMGKPGMMAYFNFEVMSVKELETMLEEMKAEEARLSSSLLFR